MIVIFPRIIIYSTSSVQCLQRFLFGLTIPYAPITANPGTYWLEQPTLIAPKNTQPLPAPGQQTAPAELLARNPRNLNGYPDTEAYIIVLELTGPLWYWTANIKSASLIIIWILPL